jgi:hypothetical protein
MNVEKHLQELIQAVLDGEPLQSNIAGGGWIDCFELPIVARIAKFVEYGASSYRIKPEVKTFTYQTRVYMVDETICVWYGTESLTEKELEAWDERNQFKWLAPAQTHTIEYTE